MASDCIKSYVMSSGPIWLHPILFDPISSDLVWYHLSKYGLIFSDPFCQMRSSDFIWWCNLILSYFICSHLGSSDIIWFNLIWYNLFSPYPISYFSISSNLIWSNLYLIWSHLTPSYLIQSYVDLSDLISSHPTQFHPFKYNLVLSDLTSSGLIWPILFNKILSCLIWFHLI